MATDGPKIIDGDTAHDTYWGIMDLYDSGASIETISNKFPLVQPEAFDDFDTEIYVTSCALALWEMGVMTKDKLDYVKKIIEKGACVKEWAENNVKDGKARQKELDKFWLKISQENKKIRARKKYRKITNLYFQPDDLLTFKFKDGKYRAIICTSIEQYRGGCYYVFVPTSYNSEEKPTLETVKDKEILGTRMGTGYDQKTTLEMQPGLERIWKLEGGNCNFFIGVVKELISHKDLSNFKDKFERVGRLQIIDGLKKTGRFGYEDSIEGLEHTFTDLENYIGVMRIKKYPIITMCNI